MALLPRRPEHIFGIGGVALSWLRTYLSHREQIVPINGVMSAAARVQYSVPQGSVLGPILFILCVTPLDAIIKRHSIDHHAYADDTQLQHSCPVDQVQGSISKMQACVNDVKTWMTENKLQLNDGRKRDNASHGQTSVHRAHSFSLDDSRMCRHHIL